LITLAYDVIWILFWGRFWSSETFAPDYWENGVNSFVLILSIINAILKVKVNILVFLIDLVCFGNPCLLDRNRSEEIIHNYRNT